jgi:hypothetical protein
MDGHLNDRVSSCRALAKRRKNRKVTVMSTVQEIEAAIEKLSPQERRELAAWYEEHLLMEESPEMLAALDEGIRSLEEKGAREYTREELEQKVRQWTGASA